jgi:virginiamycin A acetyltransferase
MTGKVKFGKSTYVSPGADLSMKQLILGDHTRISGPIRIVGAETVTIGKYCAMGSHISIISSNHKMNYANTHMGFQQKHGFVSLVDRSEPIRIGHNVWVGDKVTILPGVSIGDGAVVGAASVVTKTIPPFSVAVGNPAKVKKMRFSNEVIESLLKIQWWNWSQEKIAKNRLFFETDLEAVSAADLNSIIIDH